MKFVYNGQYKEFRGYVFFNRNPVNVSDACTRDILLKDKNFYQFDAHSVPIEPQLKIEVETSKYECKKCGKYVKQGHYMHERWCKGK